MKFKINLLKSRNFEISNDRLIKYIIIHFTGMKNQRLAIKRLQSQVAKVSCHYLISKRGKVFQLVEDKNIAWHAGKSRWETDVNLNSKSIGIELVNKGNEMYPELQIKALIKLISILKKKYKIKPKYVLGHEDVAPNRKKDPGPKFPWDRLINLNLSKKR